MPTLTCFESPEDARVFARILPRQSDSFFSFNSWLKSQNHSLPDLDRLAIAKSFTKTSLDSEKWLRTVEFLRNALILNREQVTFCFNQLPKTKKNRFLRECFEFYLASPLVQDSMSQIWALIGELKTHTYVPTDKEPLRLVPSSPSSYLFREFCEATKAEISKPLFSCKALSSLGKPTADSNPLVFHGDRVSILEELCLQISSEVSSCSTDLQVICFCGTSQSKNYLKNRLASLGFLVEDLTEEPSREPSQWSHLLTQVRKNKELSLLEKCDLSQVLINHPPYFSETMEVYFSRLHRLDILNTLQLKLLNDLISGLTEPRQAHPSRNIILIPWIPLPAIEQVHVWAFADESLLERQDLNLLLSENELESLFFSGFHLPRWTETLHSRLETFKQLSSLHPGKVYNSIPVEQLAALQVTHMPLMSSSSSTEAVPTESYAARLPIRTLSATQLETYAQCPSKYLYRRMKLKERTEPLSDFALLFGQAVHLTLEKLLANQTPVELSEVVLKEGFKLSLKEILPTNKTNESLEVVYVKAFEKFVPRIIETEKTVDRLFQPVSHLAAEQEFKIELEGFSFTGKIDRIDLLPNDRILILDYKTGNVDFTPDHLAKGTNFQALLYWFGAERATSRSPSAMLFYDLKKGEVRRGLAREECVSSEAKKELTRGHTLRADKLESLLTSGLQSLRQFSQEIQDGTFTPTPSPEACRFCEASSFCRAGVENG